MPKRILGARSEPHLIDELRLDDRAVLAHLDRPRDDRRGPRPPRRDSGGPALRLYATTEKKSDAPAADSPFAKLLELKLGGKK